MDKTEKTRQYLEKTSADSYSGLLKFFSKEDNESQKTAENIERIVDLYSKLQKGCLEDTVNFIYANIVLSKFRPESRFLWPYEKLLKRLRETLESHVPLRCSLALHFIAVMMLWPETNSKLSGEDFSDRLGSYVSQVRSSFSNEMQPPVCNGMKAVVHFYLGKGTGYDRLITQMGIDTCVGSQQTTSGKLQNGKIWANEKVQNMLHRATGRISKNVIMADTSNPNMQVEVSPMFKSQLCGDLGDRVSFFVGFSMNGPVALDIQLES